MVIFHSFLYVHQRVFSFSIICPMKMTILGCISWYMTHFPTHAIWHFVPTCLVVLKHHGTSTIDSWFSQLYLHLWGDFRIIIRLPCLMIPEEINRRWTIDEPWMNHRWTIPTAGVCGQPLSVDARLHVAESGLWLRQLHRGVSVPGLRAQPAWSNHEIPWKANGTGKESKK